MVSIRIGLRSLWQNNHETTISRGLLKSLLLLIVVFMVSEAEAEIALGKRFFDLKAARNGGAVSSQMNINKGTFMRLGTNYKSGAPAVMKLTADRTIDRTVDRAIQLASLPLANDSIDKKLHKKQLEQPENELGELKPVKGQIRHRWPIAEEISQKITSSYGFRKDPFHGHKAFHAGIDIAAPLGSKVLASADGVVAEVGSAKGLGQYVKLEHADGSYSIYGHLARTTAVKEGRKVSAGDVVGRIGMTGRTTGPHLHFGIKQGDSLINPVARLYVPHAIRSKYAAMLFRDTPKKREKPLKMLDKVASTR